MTSVGPAPPPRPAAKAPRTHVETATAPDPSFAALLDDPNEPGEVLSFNRARRDASSTRSFAEMPVVAPVAIDMTPLQTDPVAPFDDVLATIPVRPDTAVQADEQVLVPLPGRSRFTEQGPDFRAATVDPVTRRAAAGHFEAAPAVASSVGNGPGDGGEIAPIVRQSRPAPPRAIAALPFELGLGAGMSVHVIADEMQPRVVVRGARLDADERGETTIRIVRILRGHGFAISESSIEFEGGGQ